MKGARIGPWYYYRAMAEDQAKSGWLELMRGGRAAYTVLLNLAVVLHAINILVVSTVMPSIVADIGGITYYAWPAMLYMVGTVAGAVCGQPVVAALDHRRAYVLAGIIFGIGAALTAVAPSMATLMAGQLIQGFGGGLLSAISMVLVGAFYDGPLRTRVLSVVSTIWSVAAMIGPLVGGVFADMGWWRGAFWFSVVIVIGFAVLAWRRIPDSGRQRVAPHWPLLRLALLSLAVLSIGITGQLESPSATVALIIAAVGFGWMTFRIDAGAERRLFPSHVLSPLSPIGTAYWVSLLMSASHAVAFVFMPLVLQVVYGVAPLWVGYLSIIFSVAWTVGALAVSGLEGARARAAMFWGMVVMAVSTAGIAASIGVAPMWVLVAAVIVFGIGIGIGNVHIISWTMSAALPGEETVTASALPAIRSLGFAFGAATAGLIVNTAGLGDGTVKAEVAGAMTWLYWLDVAPPVLAAILVLRMLGLARRPADTTA